MQFNDITPDTLTAILTSCLDDNSNWTDPLNQFKKLLIEIRSNNPPSLSPPNQNFTNEFVFSCMPKVVAKIIDNALRPDEPAVVFLEEVITTIKFFILNYGKLQALSTLELIFDASGTFYIQNGRDEKSQYSKHLTRLAEFAIKNDIPNVILSVVEKINNTIRLSDYYEITDFFQKLSLLIDANKLFSNKEQVASILMPPLERFALETDERAIEHTQIIAVLHKLLDFCRNEQLGDTMNQIMFRFLDIDIAGLKISGIKVAVILYTKFYTYSDQTEIDSAQSTLEYILCEISNFEGLKLLEPVFTTFATRDILTDNLIDGLWNVISNMPQSVYKKSIETFSNIAVKVKNTEKIVSIATVQPINIDFVTELAKRTQFKDSIIRALFKLAEENKDLNSLESLIKISQNIDLSNYLPEICSNINCPELLKNHILLIDSILTKSRQPLDATPIISSLSKAISTFSKEDTIELLKTSASILRKVRSQISPEVLKSLYSNAQSNEIRVTTIKEFFPSDIELININDDNLQIIIDIIKSSAEQEDLFEILSHLHLTALIQNQKLKDCVFQCLWDLLINPRNEQKRKHVSNIFLTFTDYSDLENQIKAFINSCLHELEKSENKNAAIFISECLHFINGFCPLNSLGVEAHRYQAPEDMIPLHFEYEDKFDEILVDQHLTVSELTAIIALHYKKDVMSIDLYTDGEKMFNELVISEIPEVSSSVIQIRKNNSHGNLCKFTLENHPISLFHNENVERRMFELLKSQISEEIYDILILIPTLDIYSFKSASQLDPSNPHHFLYDLHFLVKNLPLKFNDEEKSEIYNVTQSILNSQFEKILPEARYLLTLLLKHDTENDDLVNIVLYTLCKNISTAKNEEDKNYALRTIKDLWKIVTNYKTELSSDVLSAFLFNENQEIFEEALSSKMILNQNFEKVWTLFTNCENKVKFLEIFTKFDIPKDFYQKVFDGLLPFYNTLNETVLIIYSEICNKWESFPCKQIYQLLVDNFIKCTTNQLPKSSTPFNLLYSIMKRSPEVNDEILKEISNMTPTIDNWNFNPTSFSEKEMIGLQNLGATCYINSVVQLVFSIEPIRNFIISTEFEDPSMKAMSKLFTEMLYSKPKYIDMHEFASKWTGFDGLPIRPIEQQDANEFLMLLFTRLERYPEIYSLISGMQDTTFTGENFEKVQSSSFNTLSLLVMGMNSIPDSMAALKLPEVFDDYKVDDGRSIQVKSYNSITKLPPYLFIQLKRFDFSIETETKIKLNQRYVFDTTIDFKDDLKQSNQDGSPVETRYKLRGVVIHQGEADAGHYFSYLLSKEDNQWYCFNDAHIKQVKESEMKSDAYGRPSGISGYLLLYERFDVDTSVPKIEANPNETLISQIKEQNHYLSITNTYFTSYFSNFVSNFMSIGEEAFNVAMNYYINALAHSSLKGPFKQFSNKIADLISKPESENPFIDYIVNYISDNINIIITIMGYSALKEIKNDFSDLLKIVFAHLPGENDIIVVIYSEFDSWFNISLENWKEGFLFFKVIYDYSTIDEDHRSFLTDFDQSILDFVVNDFGPFVNKNSSNFSIERFLQLVDLTYAFKIFEVLHTKIEYIVAPNFLEWCIGSSKHQEALIHCCNYLCPPCIPQFDKYVDSTKRAPSEYLVAELIKFPSFQVPKKWLTYYFSEPADQKHLLRALYDQFLKDFKYFRNFVEKNSETLFSLFFSKTIEVREEIVEKMTSLQEIGPVCELLLPYIEKVIEESKTLYSNNDYKFTYLPLDCFLGLHYLGFLTANINKIESTKLVQFVPLIEKSLHQLVEMKATRDEHTIPIAHIGLILLNNESIPTLSAQFITDIEAVLVKMIPDHKQLGTMIRLLCTSFSSLFSRANIPVDLLLPDNELKGYLFVIIFTKEVINMQLPQTKMIKELELTKPLVMNLFKVYTQRYAMASRSIKFLYAELLKRINEIEKNNKDKQPNNNDTFCQIDMKSVYQVLAEFRKDVVDSNINQVSQVLLQYFIGEVGEIEELCSYPDDSLIKAINYLSFVVESKGKISFEASKSKPKGVMSLIKMASNDSVNKQARITILSLIVRLLPSVSHCIPYVYGNYVIAGHFEAPEVDKYVAFVISNFLVTNSKDDVFVQSRLAEEFVQLISKTNSIDGVANTVNALVVVRGKFGFDKIKVFEDNIANADTILKIWNLKPSQNVKYDGIFEITKNIVLSGKANNYKDKLSEASNLYAAENVFHKSLSEVLNNH